jgi:hypothetical protein
MKVKTNVFFNGPHLEEELEEWLNEFDGWRVVTLTVTERESEGRAVARVVLEEKKAPVDAAAIAEANIAHQEVGALVSIILEIHRVAVDASTTDYAKTSLVKTALSKCIEPHASGGGAVVVNVSRLLLPQG